MKSLTVVKLGGSVITYKDSSPPSVNESVLFRIAGELVEFENPLIVVLGGGSYGHQAAKRYGFGDTATSPEQLTEGVPVIRRSMNLLATRVEHSFSNEGMPSVIVTPFASTIMQDGSVKKFSVDVIRKALNASLMVITHGDVCFDENRGASILSGDTIAVYLAKALGARRVLLGTDVDGVYQRDPSSDTAAELVPFVTPSNLETVLSSTGPSRATDVTGGMYRKLEELLSLASLEIETVIFNLTVPNRLKDLLHGKDIVCTRLQL
ncbi:MAG: isopentenyl phosphate kinase [Candidatus Thorarchaeota archaeon]|jgi:isopentenyl phosphate kinase